MHRVGFRLQVRPELLDEYRAHHRRVWPEMQAALTRCGWHNYSLFLHEEPINERWQALMAPYFVTGVTPADQQMRALELVFHLP